MKLKLNRTLRAALIAAITAVGFTLTSAQAEQALTITAPSGQKLEGGNSGINWSESAGNLTSWKLTFDLYENRDLGSYALFGSNGSSTCAGDTLHTTADGAITLTAGGSSISSANGSVVKQQNTAVILSYVADYNQSGVSLNKGTYTLTVGGGEAVTLNVQNDGNTTFIKNGASRLWTNGGNEKFYNITLTQLDNKVVVLPIYTWTGATNKTWDTTTQNWTLNGEPAAYSNGSDVAFTAEGMPGFGEAISIESDIAAGEMSVVDSYYTFALSNNAALSMTSLTINSGSAVAFSGAGTVTPGSAIAAAEGTISIGGGTTLVLGGYAHTLAGLSIGEGGVATTTNNSGSGCVSGEIDIEAGGIFKVIGGHDAFGYGNGATDTIVMEGAQNNLATLELNQTTGNSVTMTTDIVMHGYSQIKSAEGTKGFNTYGCSITADGTNNTIDVLDMRNDGVTITVAPDTDHPELGAELEIKKVTLNGNSGENTILVKAGTGTLYLTGESNLSRGLNITAGTVDLSGTISLSSLTVGKDGTLQVSGGSTTVGGTNTISNTVSVTGGTLALNGTFELSGIEHEAGDVKYYKNANPETEPTANGFAKATVEAQLISGNASSVTIGQDAVLTMDGVAVTYDSTTGKVVSNGELSLTTYYINENSETLSEIQAVSPTAAVTMAGGTTLNVDADMAAAITVKNGTGNVNISAGKTVTGTKNNITLAGAGTYALNSGTIALGTGTTLGQGWTGYVRISDFTPGNGQNLAAMGTSLELNGFKGWDTDKWSGTMSTNIKLTDSASNLAWVNGSFSSNTNPSPKSTFTGTWSGTGTFKSDCNSGKYIDFEYQGDISQWTGAFISTCNTDLIFSGNANAVNIDISKASGSLDLVVKNDATFSKSVAVDTLSVDASKSATFNGTATFGSVTQNAGAAITVGTEGALTIGGGSLTSAITNNGTVTFSGNITATGFEVTPGSTGLVDVNGATDSGNGFETTSGSSITIVNNGESAIVNPGDHTVTQDNVVYTIQADGTATTAAGGVDYETYFQTNGEVSVSAIQAAADKEHEVCMTAVVSDTGILNVDEGLGFISASGGEVNFIGEAAADMFFVTGDTKVSGLKDISIMSIDAGKTATMEDGLATGDVTFAATDGVKVTNTGEQAITYSLEQTDAKVTADTMTVDGDSGVEIANSLVVKEIVNNNAEGLLLLGNVADGVTLNAAGGDITLAGQTSNTVSVVDLNIAPNNTVMVDNGQEEGTVTVSGMLTGGDATLLANLTLVGGSTLDVNGGDTHALTLGSTLTFDFANSVGLVNLDDETIAALNNLAEGGELDLIVAIDSAIDPLNYGGSYDGMWYSDLFNRADGLQGDYKVYANDGAFGLVKQSSVPEPTTGTLSLLALAALAARRRRK